MASTSFLDREELDGMGFKSVGHDVKISRKASFYHCENISIGNHVRIDDFCVISACANGSVSIGSHCYMGAFCFVEATSGFVMEDFSTMAARVTVYSGTDDYSGRHLANPCVPDSLREIRAGLVRIGRHAIVGTCSVILPCVSIGDGSAVGASSLVNADLPPGGIFVGSPARFIRKRESAVFDLEGSVDE